MKRKSYTIKELETAMKIIYGENAGLEIVEPIICLLGGAVQEIRGFHNNAALIFYKEVPNDWSPAVDSAERVRSAMNDGNMVVQLPTKKFNFFGEDTTIRSYLPCMKYAPHFIPHIDIKSVCEQEIDAKFLKKHNALCDILYCIDHSFEEHKPNF